MLTSCTSEEFNYQDQSMPPDVGNIMETETINLADKLAIKDLEVEANYLNSRKIQNEKHQVFCDSDDKINQVDEMIFYLPWDDSVQFNYKNFEFQWEKIELGRACDQIDSML